MTINIGRDRMSSDVTPHAAERVGEDKWWVSWLPGRVLSGERELVQRRMSGAARASRVSGALAVWRVGGRWLSGRVRWAVAVERTGADSWRLSAVRYGWTGAEVARCCWSFRTLADAQQAVRVAVFLISREEGRSGPRRSKPPFDVPAVLGPAGRERSTGS